MDFSQEMENFADFVSEKEMLLPSLISNLSKTSVPQERLHSMRLIIKFLPNCQLVELEEMLQFVLPNLKNTLKEVFDNNVSISKCGINTAKCLMELKENLEIAINLFNVCSAVLEYTTELKNVEYQYVQSVPVNMADMILLSFQHCKTSQEVYLNSFEANEEVLNLFRKTQEVHSRFLKWLEDILILDILLEEHYATLNSVLGIIVAISEVLSSMNLKSLADNWKSYTAISQKYAETLTQRNYDLLLPLKSLCDEVQRKIEEIYETHPQDVKQLSHLIKMTNFLIKVLLKLCDIFCALVNAISKEVLYICSILYSYTPYYFQSCQYPNELIALVRSVYDNYRAFINHLLESHDLLKVLLTDESAFIHKEQFRCVELLNDILGGILYLKNKLPEKYKDEDHYALLQLIFDIIQMSSSDFLINPMLYENLVTNLVLSFFILSEKRYPALETLLLKSVLQDKFWPALLAIDVWCLFLRNMSLATCLETATYLAKKITELSFGIFSHRPEFVYLKILVWRIYQMVPLNRRMSILLDFRLVDQLFLCQVLGFHDLKASHRNCFLPLLSHIECIDSISSNLEPVNFIKMMESLDAVSSLDVNSFGVHSSNICCIVADLWSFTLPNPTVSQNNFLKYFVRKLCGITKIFLHYFNNDRLLVVLGQLKQLSISSDYKLLILDLLNAMSFKKVDSTLEQNTILAHIAEVLELLLQDSNPVIREIALEECYSFIKNSPHDQIMNSVIRNLKNTKYDVSPFLQRTVVHSPVSFHYYKLFDNARFEHKCIMWSENYIPLRTEDKQQVPEETGMSCRNSKALGTVKNQLTESSQRQNKKLKVEEAFEGEVDSLINSIKSEMKNLAKALKKESLTQKNVSDINYIVTQLRSLMQK